MPVQARSADSFVDNIGTNVHLLQNGSIYDTGYQTIIKPRLLELGLRHIRDHVTSTSWEGYYERINELGRAGIKLLGLCNETADVDKLVWFASRVSDAIEAFEGVNEHDNKGDPNWVSYLHTFQQHLQDLRKGHLNGWMLELFN